MRVWIADRATATKIIATREYGSRPGKNSTVSWRANQGFEYWFPRLPKEPSNDVLADTSQNPLIILGGGREATAPVYELGIADDSTLNPVVGKTLRAFLPAIFSASPAVRTEEYDAGEQRSHWEVEQEWTGIMGYTKIGDPFVSHIHLVYTYTDTCSFLHRLGLCLTNQVTARNMRVNTFLLVIMGMVCLAPSGGKCTYLLLFMDQLIWLAVLKPSLQ